MVSIVTGAGTVSVRSHAATDTIPTPFNAGSPKPVRPVKLVLDVPALYVLHGGSSFDGHHGFVIQPDQVAHLPKLSGAFGVRPGVGVFIKHLFAPVSARATFDLEWSRHAAKGYNAGGVPYDREYSTLVNASLELRAILDDLPVMPFLAVAPGYGWLSLPKAITVLEPNTRSTSWADLTLRGFTFAISGGASYPVTPWLAAEASVGVRLHTYTSASVGSISGVGTSAGFFGALGLSLLL